MRVLFCAIFKKSAHIAFLNFKSHFLKITQFSVDLYFWI